MISRSLGTITISIICWFHLEAQTAASHEPVKLNFYYNADWELTAPEKSIYRREAYFDLTDMVFEGVYSDYEKDGKLIADGYYTHGVKSGIHSEYTYGAVHKKIEYTDNDFTIWEWNDGKSEGVKNGTGKFYTSFFYFVSEDGTIKGKQGFLDGEFKNGRRVGTWKYNNSSSTSFDEEVYLNGKLIKHKHYTSQDTVVLSQKKAIYLSLNSLNTEAMMYDDETFSYLNQFFELYTNYPPDFNRHVAYPGGWKKFLSLLAQATMAPERTIEVLEVKINEHGQPVRFEIARSIDGTYDDLCEKIFDLHKNRFLPAINKGKPVNYVIYIPIAGGQEWITTLEEMPTQWFYEPSNFLN